MLDTRKDIDIITELGGVNSEISAMTIFRQYLGETQLIIISRIKYPEVLKETTPTNNRSLDDKSFIRHFTLTSKKKPLAMKGHTIHFDLAKEQGRIVDGTFYIANPEDDVSSLANRMGRPTALEQVKSNLTDIMKDKTMIIWFYMSGPMGYPGSNPALEITSSAYVSHTAELLYRNAYTAFDKEVNTLGHFFTNIHSEDLNRTEDLPDARVFIDRKFRTTYAWKCTYASNTLLLRKGNHRFVVNKAVYDNPGNELSEHMFITGIHGPKSRITWFAGAASRGCEKTTTAMTGDVFIGDNLSQIWITKDGSIQSINPECGIFGIVENVNQGGGPLLMKVLRQPGHEIIWFNVLKVENKLPHWGGNNETFPKKGLISRVIGMKAKSTSMGNPSPCLIPIHAALQAQPPLKIISKKPKTRKASCMGLCLQRQGC